MIRTLSFAIKNLSRQRHRTLITALALAVGIIAYIFMDSFIAGANEESIRNFQLYGTGYSSIVRVGYWDDQEQLDLTYSYDEAHQLATDIRSSGVAATTRSQIHAELIVYKDPYPEDGSLGVVLSVVDPADGTIRSGSEQVFAYAETVTEGRYFTQPTDSYIVEIVLGGWLAEDIGAQVGFPITVSTESRLGYKQTFDAEIVGILNSPDPVVNRTVALVSAEQVDELLQLGQAANEVVLPVVSNNQLALVDGIVPNGLVRLPFDTLIEEYLVFLESETVGSDILLFVVFVIAAVGVSNTFLMATLERKREIGMLQSIGMRRGEIKRVLVTEAALLGLLAGSVGSIVGAALNILLVRNGIDYSRWIRDFDLGYRVSGVFYGSWQIPTYFVAVILATVLAMITSYLPVARIFRKNTIVELLRD